MNRANTEKQLVANLITQVRSSSGFDQVFTEFRERRDNLLHLDSYVMLLQALNRELRRHLASMAQTGQEAEVSVEKLT